MKVFGSPISSDDAFNNYQKSVSKESIKKIKDEVIQLKENCLWGIKTSKQNAWNSIEKGDLIFFYRRSHIISICEVVDKFQDIDLSIKLWGYFESVYHPTTTFSLIISLKPPLNCNIPFKCINEILGYNESYSLRSFFQLKSLEKIIENKFKGNLNEFVNQYSI